MFFCQHLWAHSQFMTIFIRWAHSVYKYFFFILGMAFSILCGLWVQHGLKVLSIHLSDLPAIESYNHINWIQAPSFVKGHYGKADKAAYFDTVLVSTVGNSELENEMTCGTYLQGMCVCYEL